MNVTGYHSTALSILIKLSTELHAFVLPASFHYKMLCRVNPDILEHLSRDCPDCELVNYVVNGFRNGFALGMTKFPESNAHDLPKNAKLVREKPEEAQKLVDVEIEKGHMLGPFDEPPMEGMSFSPINLVEKAGGKEGEYRLIHDLAFPYDGESSVNTCIPPENSKVCYHHIDEVIDMALEIGQSVKEICADIRHAFRNLGLRFDQIKYMGFTLKGKFYINVCLPFRAASSCLIFEKVAMLLEWIVVNETRRRYISHYLDDFPLLSHSDEDAQAFLDAFLDIMEQIGMPIAENKTIGPTPFLVYLGMLLNFLDQVLAIPEKKRTKCLELIDGMIQAYRSHQQVQVKDVQKLAGHLNFVSQVIPAGKPFMAGLYTNLAP